MAIVVVQPRQEAAMKWRHIGCPVDFSETSRAALEAAAELAARFDAELVLIHVSEEPAAIGPASIFAPPPAPRRVETHRADLEAWVNEAGRGGRARVRSALVRGRPAEEIIRFAHEEHLDLVVMGTHGRRGFRHLLLGSVAEEVVRGAPCPVLVIRPPGARPGAAGAHYS